MYKMADLKGSKTEANLQAAFAGESQAHTKYQYFAAKAKEEGYVQIHDIFMETSKNEREHAKIWYKLLHDEEIPDEGRYRTLLANVEAETVFKKEEEIEWKCENCGFIFKGPQAPEMCPVCGYPKAHFEERAQNYK